MLLTALTFVVVFVVYGLGYLHGRGHRFIDDLFGRSR